MDTTHLTCLLRSLATSPSRRSVARALTGFALGGALIPYRGPVEAKRHKHRHKKKKRCRKSLQSCGGKKKCCASLTCGDTSTLESVCCKPPHGTCMEASECCGERACAIIDGLQGPRCCFQFGPCTDDQDCCSGYYCNGIGSCQQIP